MDRLLPYLWIALSSFIVYLFIVFGLRLFGKKELAQLSLPDLVFVLLISNAVQNAMVGSDSSLSGGLVVATTLFITNFLFKKVLYKFTGLQQFLEGEAVVLIYNGRVNEQNIRKVEITVNELMEIIREHGTKDISSVNLAMLEVDGNVSVITDDFQKQSIQTGVRKRKKHKSEQ